MKLQELRKAKGMTRAELERVAGIRPRGLESYETGFRNPNKMALDTAVKVADALGVHPRELLEDKEN